MCSTKRSGVFVASSHETSVGCTSWLHEAVLLQYLPISPYGSRPPIFAADHTNKNNDLRRLNLELIALRFLS